MPKRFNFEVIPLSEVPADSRLMTDSPRPQTVLVVDDEPLIASTLVSILRARDYAATAAHNGAEALAFAEVMPPDILLTDVMMPGMNGVELAIALKGRVPNCRVILFSGHAYLNNVLDDPRCAGYDFPLLSKPIHPDDLLAKISSVTHAVFTAA